MAKAYACRPSQLYAIKDEFIAFTFDRAVATLAVPMEAEIKQAINKAKNSREADRKVALIVKRWLDSGDATEGKKFRDPAAPRG